MKLSQRFIVAGVLLVVGGAVIGLVPVGGGCGSPFFHQASDDATCVVAQGVLRGPAIGLLVVGALLWLVGVGRLGFDDEPVPSRS